VLVLRAATGRDWIIDQFRAADAEVDALAVYDRSPRALSEGDRTRLVGWMRSGVPPITVVSSAEAVGAILEQVQRVEGAAEWLRGGFAIATHPRVAQRLRAAGFANVEACAPEDSAVIGKLESIQG
jgi:uroporphyrinogen-III synthase